MNDPLAGPGPTTTATVTTMIPQTTTTETPPEGNPIKGEAHF